MNNSAHIYKGSNYANHAADKRSSSYANTPVPNKEPPPALNGFSMSMLNKGPIFSPPRFVLTKQKGFAGADLATAVSQQVNHTNVSKA